MSPQRGIAYRPAEDAPLVEVHLVWWCDDPPHQLACVVDVARQA